jgi:hypothetical protein
MQNASAVEVSPITSRSAKDNRSRGRRENTPAVDISSMGGIVSPRAEFPGIDDINIA